MVDHNATYPTYPLKSIVSIGSKTISVSSALLVFFIGLSSIVSIAQGLQVNMICPAGPSDIWNASSAFTTLAGNGTAAFQDGFGTQAAFKDAYAIAITPDESAALITDDVNEVVRKINLTTNEVTTFAGSPGVRGFANGVGTHALFAQPRGIVITPDGKTAFVAELESADRLLRSIDVESATVSVLAGGPWGFADGIGTNAQFMGLMGLAITPDGLNILACDYYSNRVRHIVIATREVSTLAGDGTDVNLDGIGTSAKVGGPSAVAVTPDGQKALVVQSGKSTITMIDLTTKAVTLIAGQDGQCTNLDGIGTAATFCSPRSVVVLKDGLTALVGDSNSRIRAIDLASWTVTTTAGGNGNGHNDGSGSEAKFNSAPMIHLAPSGLFALVGDDTRVRRLDLCPVKCHAECGRGFALAQPGSCSGLGTYPTCEVDLRFSSRVRDAYYWEPVQLSESVIAGNTSCALSVSGRSVTIIGKPENGTVIDCTDTGMPFLSLSGGASVKLVNVTLIGGSAAIDGGLVKVGRDSLLDAENVLFKHGSALGGAGGCLFVSDGATASLKLCSFQHCSASEGDSVAVHGGSLTMWGGVVEKSTMTGSSIVVGSGNGTGSNVTLYGTRFSGSIGDPTVPGTFITNKNSGSGKLLLDGNKSGWGDVVFEMTGNNSNRAYQTLEQGVSILGRVHVMNFRVLQGGIFSTANMSIPQGSVLEVVDSHGGAEGAIVVETPLHVFGSLRAVGCSSIGTGGAVVVKKAGELNVLPGGVVSLVENQASEGGAIFVYGSVYVFEGGSFNMTGNKGVVRGGAIFMSSSAVVSFQGPVLQNLTNPPEGGPASGTVTLVGNTAPLGAGMFISGSTAVFLGPLPLNTRGFLAADVPGSNFPSPFSVLYSYNATGMSEWECFSGYHLDQASPPEYSTCLSNGGPGSLMFRNSSQARAAGPYCSPGCQSMTVADGACNVACLSAECAWDVRDCWDANKTLASGPVQGGLHGVKVRRSATMKFALHVLLDGDSNGDGVIDRAESLASFGLSAEQHTLLSGSVGWLVTAGRLSDFLVSLMGAIDGIARFEGNIEAAGDLFVRLGDRGMRDLALDVSEAKAAGVSEERFRQLDLDGDGMVSAWEVSSNAGSDPCGFSRFTAVPPATKKGKIVVTADALWGERRDCLFLIQPDWFYPAERKAPPKGDISSTVSLYTEPAGAPNRVVACLGALVHARWVLSSAGACGHVRFASVGGQDIEVEQVVVHPGFAGWSGGNDVALIMLKGAGSVDAQPVMMQEHDTISYNDCSAYSLVTPRPNATMPTLWQEASQLTATLAQCSDAHIAATGDPIEYLTPTSTVCASPVDPPCNPTGNQSLPPSPGTPLLLRRGPEDASLVLLGLAASGALPATCGEAPPSVYTLVPSVIQWIRSVSSDLGSYAPKGVGVTVPPWAGSAVSGVSVHEAHAPVVGVGETAALAAGDSDVQCTSMAKVAVVGRGSVLVNVSVARAQQPTSCSRGGGADECIGLDFEAKWSEVTCANFSVTAGGSCGGPAECVVAREESGAAVCADPQCRLDMVPEQIVKRLKSDQVWGGLGGKTFSEANAYACVREWDNGAAMACGARSGEYVCFRYYESEKRFEFFGLNSEQNLVKPAAAAAKLVKRNKEKKMHTLDKLFETLRVKDGSLGATAAWWKS
mmetsp:Transcript_15846/g.31253  ORF Transcript_15846/g.31253 Transcript_15846/m.31253 type:complete len:1661 (+) Transcript_15846:229-5211(+)|eukprot:CAMPEP_0173387950 /NCGR_PEP_ID=MMETSP1356-20130122/10356_1 /TAXON_ID=77927 ORGANISM="Hemiselmis virescens, Strain PCC157" /NCGR_SAMPLE_ID=MMETSP1356 /ASSEMBLY_ACC=CAM_ASM_000847 /LENGTH=1660 /DNA_ID=CAMNT_0014344713 /DNA_START=142 /DNA_END=5124 /DNA_ORIENTATION=+